ncbi:MAG: glycosyltransferase [Sulfurihydrogenibium sp.]|nr:glycosyltransferase [Sulfurihydrogenibium sp.]
MNLAPLVSVVIPTYNRANLIKKSIQSVINGDYKNIEVIVVDDHSTDNTYQIVSALQAKDSRIRYIKLDKKSGAQAARNRGIIEARGEFIAFLDSDDSWESNKLAIQMEALKSANYNPYMVIHSNCFCYDEATGKKWIWKLPITEGKCYELLLQRPSPVFPSILTSKIALFDIGLLDENIIAYQEWDTSIRLSKICEFVHIQEPLFTYHLHSGKTISKDPIKDIQGYFQIVEKNKFVLKEKGYLCGHIRILIHKLIEFNDFRFMDEILSYLKYCNYNQGIIKNLLMFNLPAKLKRILLDVYFKTGGGRI